MSTAGPRCFGAPLPEWAIIAPFFPRGLYISEHQFQLFCAFLMRRREREREISQQSEQNSQTCREMLQTFTNQFSVLLSHYCNCFRVFSRSGSCLVQNKNHKKSIRSNKIQNCSQWTICPTFSLIEETVLHLLNFSESLREGCMEQRKIECGIMKGWGSRSFI